MRHLALAGAVLALAVPALAAARGPLVYPVPPRSNVVDTYWSTPVPDPYRPLENIDSPETQAWLRAEEAVTRAYLDAIPQRAAIKAAYERMQPTSPYVTALVHHGQVWSLTSRAPGKRTVIFVRDGPSAADRPLLDENELPANVSVAYVDWSRDGTLLAYGTETNGSDWLTWHVRNVASATDRSDVVRWGKYIDVSFLGDAGFYYSGYDAPASGHESDGSALGAYKAFYHRLGTPQSEDLLLAEGPAASNQFPATLVTADGRFAVTWTGPIDRNGVDVFAADQPRAPRRVLIDAGSGPALLVGNIGQNFFFRTNGGSPNGRIVEVDAGDPQHRLRTVIPERSDALTDASLIGDRLYLHYLHDVHSVLEIADVDGRSVGTIALPGIGTATPPEGDARDGYAYYTYESFIEAKTTYRYDLKTGKSSVAARDPYPFDPAPYVTEQLFATSKDGTRVPVFVTRRRDLPYDGTTPTVLWGYGGFGETWTLTPTFGPALWLRMGGAYAVVNARGGGEYGEAWHRAGMLENKQHVFDDVIAAAQLLIARKVTSPGKLALQGASGGGLMVGAVIVERPDLFGAAIPDSAPLDMLRFQKFTVGANWASETGSSDQSEAMFRALYAYSPLQNVREGVRYPATLIATGDHDDRVFPAHSYKFAAALQHAQGGDAPILLRVATNGGHDFGTAGNRADTVADRFAFLAKSLNFTPTL
jgi:prolyl oligopeptidase